MTTFGKKCTLLSVGLSCLTFAFLPAHSLFKGKPSAALVVMGVLRFVINKHHVLKTLHGCLNTTSVLNVAAQLGQIIEFFFFRKFSLVSACRKMVKNACNNGLTSCFSPRFLSCNQIQSLPQWTYTCELPHSSFDDTLEAEFFY